MLMALIRSYGVPGGTGVYTLKDSKEREQKTILFKSEKSALDLVKISDWVTIFTFVALKGFVIFVYPWAHEIADELFKIRNFLKEAQKISIDISKNLKLF